MKKLADDVAEKWAGDEDEATRGWRAALLVSHRLIKARARLATYAAWSVGVGVGALVGHSRDFRIELPAAALILLVAIYLMIAWTRAYVAYVTHEAAKAGSIKIIEQGTEEIGRASCRERV